MRILKLFVALCAVATFLLASRVSHAESWQAPIGGAALPLGEGRVACAGTSGDWTIEQDGHAVRPPASSDSPGKAFDLRVAPTAAQCAATTTVVRLVATGRWPAMDAAGTTLFVDDGRVEVRGRGLRGAQVRWQLGHRSGMDRCPQPQSDPSGERCSMAVGRGLPADPSAGDLSWLPAGASDAADAVSFDASGRRVPREELVLRPARVVVSALLPPGVSVDLAGGTASRIPLLHPEAVAGADCGSASCAVSNNVVFVSGLSTVSGTFAVRLRLAPRVVLQRGDRLTPRPSSRSRSFRVR